MSRETILKFDEIGYWSEIKLDIVKDYATAYSRILSAQRKPELYHVYIDAFAGAGVHKSKTKGEFVPGSPLNALLIEPRFRDYYFIDLSPLKTANLKKMILENECKGSKNVHIYEGNCNSILLKDVFPRVQYGQYRRGLCLLDPYGLDLDWEVVKTAGQMKSIEIFLNFPIADMNRNVIWHHPEGVSPADIERMNAYWGDDSWRTTAYTTKRNLFGFEEKEESAVIAECFRKRLQETAGFSYVSSPLAMKNTKNATVYYLYFASQKPVAKKIVDDIFNKYSKKL